MTLESKRNKKTSLWFLHISENGSGDARGGGLGLDTKTAATTQSKHRTCFCLPWMVIRYVHHDFDNVVRIIVCS